MSPSLSDFAMTRELKQLAGTTYNDSLSELGELLQDIMQSPQLVQMFLLSISEKKFLQAQNNICHLKSSVHLGLTTQRKKSERKKLGSVVVQQCGLQLGC